MATKKMTRPIEVRNSKIHGRGVFATRDIPAGERLIEYTGERITWQEAERRYPVDPVPYHTFLFEVGDGTMCLDATKRGGAGKWFNHSCDGNCEAIEDEGERMFIHSTRRIRRGEELTYDYNITLETRHTPAEKKKMPCLCGVRKCRGTILAKKR
ncbi:MAG: SET domain-containing protein [Betaproteobacteria bacterium]|nr:SET domain-containing protein [Betaproteobacteria bacterium]